MELIKENESHESIERENFSELMIDLDYDNSHGEDASAQETWKQITVGTKY